MIRVKNINNRTRSLGIWILVLALCCLLIKTLTGLMLFAVVFIGLLIAARKYSKSLMTFVLPVFIALGIMGMQVVNHYTFPKDTQIFSNTDYHVLEHAGFDYQKELHLVNTQDSLHALWDGKKGLVTLRDAEGEKVDIEIKEFYEPFYVEKKLEDQNRYQLVNNLYDLDVSKGFTVSEGDQPVFRFEARDFVKDGKISKTKAVYKFGAGTNPTDSIEFDKKIFVGYPFSDLLAQSNLPKLDALLDLFEGSYLLRGEYSTNTDKSLKGVPLYFFPGKNLAEATDISISNSEATLTNDSIKRSFSVQLSHNDRFYVGLGKGATEKMLVTLPEGSTIDDTDKRILKFDFPQKFKLKGDPENLLFISSSLDEVIQNTLDGGYYFPLFESSANKNHCLGSIRYDKGDSKKAILFQINDQYNESVPSIEESKDIGIEEVYADQDFLLSTKNKEQQVQWRFRVTNLRASNALSLFKLYGFIITYIVLVILVVRLVGSEKIHLIEVCSYIALFVFLLLRILLHWRISTFVPIEDISKHEYINTLRSGTWFNFTLGWTLLFFACRIAIHYLGSKAIVSKSKEKLFTYWQKLPFWKYMLTYLAVCLGAILASIYGPDFVERILNIFVPISLYFAVSYLNKLKKTTSFTYFDLEPFQLFNTLLIMAWIFVADAGFGIIFFLFVCLRGFLTALIGKPSRTSGIRAIVFGVFFLGIIFRGSKIISTAITHREITYIVISAITILILAGLLWVIYQFDQLKTRGWFRIMAIGLVLFVGATLFYGYQSGYPDRLSKFNYVKYRAQIHHTAIDDLIQQEQFKSSEVSQILRAGQNQWFINAYLKKGQFEPENSTAKYFSIKPHFNKGSGYTTQTRDVVVTRYIIAEHGERIVLGLILLIVALLVLYIFEYRVAHDQMGLNAVILLFTIAFFVWLTATNRFIFFGQDFPFLSTTSKLTLYLPFLLFLVSILSKEKSDESKAKDLGNTKRVKVVVATLGVLLVTGAVLKTQDNILAQNLFDIKETITETKGSINTLNKYLKVYQNELNNRESEYYDPSFDKDKIVEFYTNPNNLNLLVDGFNDYLDREIRDDRISPEKISKIPFVNSIYNYFWKELRNKRDPEEILHLIVKNNYLQLAINEQYYLIEPPSHQQNKWMGHLYAAEKELSFTLENTNDDTEYIVLENDAFVTDFDWMTEKKNIRNYQISAIPASWTHENEMALLLRQKATNTNEERGKFKTINNASSYTSFEQAYNSFALRFIPNDFINVYDPKNRVSQYKLVKNSNNYLMRNLWLNGKQRFFYPLGEDFIWAYNYSNAIKAKYSNKKNVNDNVRVSLDYDLTKRLNALIKKYAKKKGWNKQSFAVSVVDGNGRIRAMVDYVKGKRLNPNDIKGLLKFRRESYAIQSPSSGRDEKGNLNLFQTKIGPGSSIKPVMYAATTSQYDFDWSSLSLQTLTPELKGQVMNQNGKLKSYGGKRITPWALTEVDQLASNNQEYLIKSSNTYHSLVMFLGSYNKEALRTNATSIFKPFDRDSVSYPLFGFNGRKAMTFDPNGWPKSKKDDSDFFGNTNSILAEGLKANFDLKVSWPKEIRRTNHVNFDPIGNTSVFDNNPTEFKSFSYPEISSFIHDNREQRRGFGRAIRQSTLGGSPVVITPLKMSEMGGRLISMNRNFKVTLDDTNTVQDFTPFVVDEASWGTPENYFESFYKPQLINSLEKVISSPSGTMRSLQGIQKKSPYFYYAKTGTINNETRKRNRQSDKLLLLMISRDRIDDLSFEEVRSNKFYTMYFACYECGNQPYELLKDIIEEVEVNNDGLEKYFNQGKPNSTN